MIIRAGSITDAHHIAEIHVASWKAAYGGLIPDLVLDALLVSKRAEMWRRVVAEQKFQLLVAEHDDRIVGFVNFGPTRDQDKIPGHTGEILAIYVDSNHWHEGIGRKLLEAALAELKPAGFNEATLWVLDANFRGRVFYERAGFSIDGAVQSEVIGDKVKIHEVRYRRPL
jgi:GNAT superfamily N-acetyltransferase